MALGMRRRDRLVQNTRPTLMTRLRGPNARKRTVKTTTKIEPGGIVQGHDHTHTHHTHSPTHNHYTRSSRSRWTRGRRTTKPTVHRRRRVSFGDKISGAMMKLRGSLTNRPGVKAAGTRRMHGTDGLGVHVY